MSYVATASNGNLAVLTKFVNCLVLTGIEFFNRRIMKMRIIINEGRKVAVPTTRFESDALYYLKYDIMDDYGNLDIYQVGR